VEDTRLRFHVVGLGVKLGERCSDGLEYICGGVGYSVAIVIGALAGGPGSREA
jgi:hypothetical protein